MIWFGKWWGLVATWVGVGRTVCTRCRGRGSTNGWRWRGRGIGYDTTGCAHYSFATSSTLVALTHHVVAFGARVHIEQETFLARVAWSQCKRFLFLKQNKIKRVRVRIFLNSEISETYKTMSNLITDFSDYNMIGMKFAHFQIPFEFNTLNEKLKLK